MKSNKVVFLGMPHRERRIGVCQIHNILSSGQVKKKMLTGSHGIQTMNANMLYVAALNDPEVDVFCYLHDDIRLPENWMEKMLDIMEKNDADVLSVVAPIKDKRGLTSIALDEFPLNDNIPAVAEHRVRRLTLKEIHENYPPTFTHPKLLINNGCVMINMRHPRAKDIYYRFDDRIVHIDGKYIASTISDDWLISRDCQKFGMKVFATREIYLVHEGNMDYDNTKWGNWDTDLK